MRKQPSARGRAVLLALLVTFLWSISFVLIKFGLGEMGPLLFAGIRYTLAFLCLLPFALTKSSIAAFRELDKRTWRLLILLGVLYYAVTQGAQFVGLSLLPAVTVSLIFNFTPVVVAFMSLAFILERPSGTQWIGLLLFFVGVLIYFYPLSLDPGQGLGVVIMMGGMLANAASSILGRALNRSQQIPPILITVISMGVGAILLLAAGWLVQPVYSLSWRSLLLLLWLAIVSSALAFTLWNHALRTLTAVESSIINGTMLVQIAILAWIFLKEPLAARQIGGLLATGVGALIVQLRPDLKRILNPTREFVEAE